jgi:hypothetical protein
LLVLLTPRVVLLFSSFNSLSKALKSLHHN